MNLLDTTAIRRSLSAVRTAIAGRLARQSRPSTLATQATQAAQADTAPQPLTAADLALRDAVAILADQSGYRRTLESKRPTAADGSPLPWYTYPAIEYFNQLDARGLRIFEYGCGNSSLYWSRKGAEVWSVEHDPAWHAAMVAQSAGLKGLALRETREAYAAAVHEPGATFDMIVVDGIWRPACAAQALQALAPHGVILLDNSDWYTDVAALLRQNGFFPIDFNGFGPCNPYCWTTSLFLPFRSPLTARLQSPVPIGGIAVQQGENW